MQNGNGRQNGNGQAKLPAEARRFSSQDEFFAELDREAEEMLRKILEETKWLEENAAGRGSKTPAPAESHPNRIGELVTRDLDTLKAGDEPLDKKSGKSSGC
jgi:hypothetical protein